MKQSTWFDPKPSLLLWSNVAHKYISFSSVSHVRFTDMSARINAKLGGINVVINPAAFTVPARVPLLGEKDGTMVMGKTRLPFSSFLTLSKAPMWCICLQGYRMTRQLPLLLQVSIHTPRTI